MAEELTTSANIMPILHQWLAPLDDLDKTPVATEDALIDALPDTDTTALATYLLKCMLSAYSSVANLPPDTPSAR
jgi:hypothetical protein